MCISKLLLVLVIIVKIAKWYNDLSNTGQFQVDSETLQRVQSVFTASSSTDQERLDTIKEISEAHKHGIDPHTASGVHPFIVENTKTSVVFLETSHVAQFWRELKNVWLVVPGMDEFDEVITAMEQNTPVDGTDFLTITWDFREAMMHFQHAIDHIFPSQQ